MGEHDRSLISITAHALLNRIYVINGAVALLRTHGRTDDDEELLAIIGREAKQMVDLLDVLVRGQTEPR